MVRVAAHPVGLSTLRSTNAIPDAILGQTEKSVVQRSKSLLNMRGSSLPHPEDLNRAEQY